jgi:hypothetical protein
MKWRECTSGPSNIVDCDVARGYRMGGDADSAGSRCNVDVGHGGVMEGKAVGEDAGLLARFESFARPGHPASIFPLVLSLVIVILFPLTVQFSLYRCVLRL